MIRTPDHSVRGWILFIGVSGSSLAVVALLGQYQVLAFSLLVALGIVQLARQAFERPLVITYLATCILGPVAEMVGIAFGHWSYTAPVLYSIPLWLPPLWGNAFLLFVKLYERVRSAPL